MADITLHRANYILVLIQTTGTQSMNQSKFSLKLTTLCIIFCYGHKYNSILSIIYSSNNRVEKASASGAGVDSDLIPSPGHSNDSKIGIHCFLFDAQH